MSVPRKGSISEMNVIIRVEFPDPGAAKRRPGITGCGIYRDAEAALRIKKSGLFSPDFWYNQGI